jgi:hypothetical protein
MAPSAGAAWRVHAVQPLFYAVARWVLGTKAQDDKGAGYIRGSIDMVVVGSSDTMASVREKNSRRVTISTSTGWLAP